MKITVCRKEHFNAAHRLHISDWSDEKNATFFDKCNNANFHGHNYDLEVKVTGEIDPISGYMMDMKHLRDIIRSEVTDRFDHKNLNLDVSDFKNLNPTAENIAVVIYNRMKSKLPENIELKIVLYETERNFVEFPA